MEVSKEFVEIYKNFNVINQTEKIKNLTRKERILLLILAIDSFSEDSPISLNNFTPFKEELLIINDIESDQESTDVDILELIKDTGYSKIDTSVITNNGEKLPTPLTEEEATIKRRDIGIDTIIN